MATADQAGQEPFARPRRSLHRLAALIMVVGQCLLVLDKLLPGNVGLVVILKKYLPLLGTPASLPHHALLAAVQNHAAFRPPKGIDSRVDGILQDARDHPRRRGHPFHARRLGTWTPGERDAFLLQPKKHLSRTAQLAE